MLSRTGMHAVRAAAALARLPAGRFTGVGHIARQIGAPPNYLAKLLQLLVRHGVVQSQKGSGGGFRLARPPEELKLIEIVAPLEPLCRWRGCILGRSECSEQHPCVVHQRWSEIRSAYLRMLEQTTVADLLTHGEPVPLTPDHSCRLLG